MTDPGFHIYVITNTVNGKQYVGMTSKGVRHRWLSHKNKAATGGILPIHAAIRKHGADAFRVEHVASASTPEQMGHAEQAVIDQFGSLVPGGYNIAAGGRGGAVPGAGRKPNPEGTMVTRCCTLSREVCDYLETLPNASEEVRNLIRDSHEFGCFIGRPEKQALLF